MVDGIRQKFTGYQKDEETQLDFAEARMYENRYGRFTAVDPLLASGKNANPQTFNRFAYVGNNPIRRVDKKGLEWYDVVTTVKNASGEITSTLHSPIWIPWKVVVGTVGRGELEGPNAIASKWTEHRDFAYEITSGENSGKFAVLDPNSSASTVVDSQLDASYQLALYKRETNYFDVMMAKTVMDSWGNAAPLLNATANHPQFDFADRYLNPDGITAGYRLPLFGSGGSITVTRKFDFIGSFSQGNSPSELVQLANGNGLKGLFNTGGLSILATKIDGPLLNADQTKNFFMGGSTTVAGCYVICAGRTTSTGSGVGGNSYGFSPSIAPSGGITVSYAPSFFYLGNPHRRFFGTTPLNSPR